MLAIPLRKPLLITVRTGYLFLYGKHYQKWYNIFGQTVGQLPLSGSACAGGRCSQQATGIKIGTEKKWQVKYLLENG